MVWIPIRNYTMYLDRWAGTLSKGVRLGPFCGPTPFLKRSEAWAPFLDHHLLWIVKVLNWGLILGVHTN